MAYALKNKTVFITGASSGIGKATAELFAAAGARVLICARRLDKIEALVDKLKLDHAVEVYGFALDVGDAKKIQEKWAQLPKEWRAIDVLVNNAGFALSADSLMPYVADPVVNLTITGLFIIGGLGFSVWIDLRRNKRWSNLTIYRR